MSRQWFVVADNSRTRIFTREEPGGRLQAVETLDNPEAGAHAQDIDADRPGRSFDSVGGGRHSMGTEVDPVTQGLLRYVKTVTGFLATASGDGRCNRVVLVAGPRLLGMLRQQLDLPANVEVSEIDKNLGQYDANELVDHLPARL